jgi:hypothetical protein
MRIKLDENLPAGLVGDLQALGHDVDTVPSEALAGHPDPDVWNGAQAAKRILLTQDLDFSDIERSVRERTTVWCWFDFASPGAPRCVPVSQTSSELSRWTSGMAAWLYSVTERFG